MPQVKKNTLKTVRVFSCIQWVTARVPPPFPTAKYILHLLWCYQGSIRNRSKLSPRVTVSSSDTQQSILNTQCLKNARLKATYAKVLNRWSIRQAISNFQKFPKNSYQKCHIFHCFAFGFPQPTEDNSWVTGVWAQHL